MKLAQDELEPYLAAVPEWGREGEWIIRRYGFRTFPESIAFVNRIAVEAEARNHHPLIAIDYRHVTLRLSSWHAGGLTTADFDLARQADELFARMFSSSSD
ncbi:MAG: 4a-hydroxytetrahydrobiopterin dehydratase [Bacilli bacterium]